MLIVMVGSPGALVRSTILPRTGPSGHVDVKLVQSLKGDLWYLAKYLVRSADSLKGELGMALSRDFGRRVWSKSRSWPAST